MTDARLPERWLADRRLQRLSDSAHRAFITALLWSVSNRTDGVIEREDLALIPGWHHGSETELVKAELWGDLGSGWLIIEFADTQTSKDDLVALAKARKSKREAQRKWRESQRHAGQGYVDSTVESTFVDSTETSRETSTPQDRTGQACPVPVSKELELNLSLLKKTEVVAKSGTSLGGQSKSKRATRLPLGWEPPPDAVEVMRTRFPHVDLDTQYEMFCNYWHSKSGQDATKIDWVATWRNWIIKAADQTPQRNGHQLSGPDRKAVGFVELTQRLDARSRQNALDQQQLPRKELM